MLQGSSDFLANMVNKVSPRNLPLVTGIWEKVMTSALEPVGSKDNWVTKSNWTELGGSSYV